jgi:predicted Zn-dependent protease
MGIFDQNQGYPTQRRSFLSRLMVAGFIAVVGLIMYFSQSQENPVTGEKQYVSLSPSQEIRLGLQSAPLMAAEMGGDIPQSDPRAQQVSKIGNYIVDHSIAIHSPWKFQFHLLNDPQTVNAFALPGGQVFITLGLYKKLTSTDELAGVLGHEIGHVIERHSAQQMATGQLGQILIAAVTAGATDQNQSSGGNYSAAMVASVVNQMFQLKYSRHDELEADLWGLKLLKQAGFDPWALVKVMEVLKKSSGGEGGSDFFKTHPDPDYRIEKIKEYLKGEEKGSSVNL